MRTKLEPRAIERFGHSLACNGCDFEIHVLNNPYDMLEGLGFRFVAWPRHADLQLVTGPVSRHMQVALNAPWVLVGIDLIPQFRSKVKKKRYVITV